MKTYYHILNTLDLKLHALEKDLKNQYELFEQSIVLCKTALISLKKESRLSNFKNQKQEIEFFKTIKPKVVSYLIFYIKRLHIESKRAKEGKKEQKKYLKKCITKFQSYFNNNLEFYHYYKSNATYLDEQYFLVKNQNTRLNIEVYHFFTEDAFSTTHDNSVATIIAYTKLINYLKNEICKLKKNTCQIEMINSFQKESTLKWTANKTDLVELIYALHATGTINSGTADIKEMASFCEQLFNIGLGDYYRTYLEIRSRKINQTKFLDKLKESLILRMENADE